MDAAVQTVVLYWAKRLGKTEIINNVHGHTIEHNPRNILVVYPTLDSAKKWSKQFFMPMVRSTKSLANRIGKIKSRDASNTILSKEYPGGTISAIGANSPSGFRQVQAPVVTCDEIDAMDNTPEGDPVALAFARAENYSDCIQIVSSTATKILPPKDGENLGSGSRIHDFWLSSDQRKWFCPCPDCGKKIVLDDEPDFVNRKLNNLKWPIVEISKGVWEHRIEEAYYECPECHSHWDDTKRLQAIRAGEWQPTAPQTGVRGYWLSGFNTVFPPKKGFKTKLHQFSAEFLDACKKGESAQIVWLNTFLCKPKQMDAERMESKPLLERVEAYTKDALPDKIAILACVTDVQGDRIEYEIIGMGDGEETWGIEYGKIIGDLEEDDVWNRLKDTLNRKFKRQDGVELSIDCAALDLRFKPKRVRNFIKKCGLPRVYGVYGASNAKRQVNLVVPKKNKFYGSWSYSVNTIQAKDTIFARLKLKEQGARYMHWHEGYDKDYFDGLTAEEKRIHYVHGFPEPYYEKIRARNEPLDLRVYFLAVMDILKPNIEAIRRNLMATQDPAKEYVVKDAPKIEAPKPEAKKPFAAQPRRGFVSGWKR